MSYSVFTAYGRKKRERKKLYKQNATHQHAFTQQCIAKNSVKEDKIGP